MTAAATTAPKTEVNASGFYIYLGPTIRGVIQQHAIFRGSREDALKAAAKAIKVNKLVKTLIVSGDSLASARLKVKTPGNAMYVNYRKIRSGQ